MSKAKYKQKQTEKDCNNCAMQHKCAGFIYGNYWCWRPKQTDEMSLSDAIKWIKDYFRTTDMPMPQYEKAFEMAIKSMEYIDDHAL